MSSFTLFSGESLTGQIWGVTDRAETFITYFDSCVSVVFIVRLRSPVLFVKL